MYIPKHFSEEDHATIHALIHEHPLCTLVTQTPSGMVANHIPLHLSPHEGAHGVLRGHVARGNPFWREALADSEVLAIFQGTNAYISPSWYPTKVETGKAVPTWNYVSVHAYGKLRIIDDAAWLKSHLSELTAQHEANQPNPWSITDAPPDYIDAQLKAIVGIEIEITQLQGKWKTSQNQPLHNQAGVIEGLRKSGEHSPAKIADIMANKLQHST